MHCYHYGLSSIIHFYFAHQRVFLHIFLRWSWTYLVQLHRRWHWCTCSNSSTFFVSIFLTVSFQTLKKQRVGTPKKKVYYVSVPWWNSHIYILECTHGWLGWCIMSIFISHCDPVLLGEDRGEIVGCWEAFIRTGMLVLSHLGILQRQPWQIHVFLLSLLIWLNLFIVKLAHSRS